jgi:hypothetical protein
MSDATLNDHAPRLAVLEEIARGTKAALERIERRLDAIERNARSDFRWLLGIMLSGFGLTLGGFVTLLGVIAHTQHWI